VFGDCNSPVIGSWFYNEFHLSTKNAKGFFRQPGAILSDGTINPSRRKPA
jgi:hypothetical protein